MNAPTQTATPATESAAADAVTSGVSVVPYPDLPFLPPHLRGRRVLRVGVTDCKQRHITGFTICLIGSLEQRPSFAVPS